MKINNIKYLIFLPLVLTWILSSCYDNAGISPDQSTSFLKFYGNSFNDNGFDVGQTPDGGYLVVGSGTSVQNGTGFDKDIVAIKTDEFGNIIEGPRYMGGAGDDEGYTFQALKEGGFVIAGYTTDNPDNNRKKRDILVVKTDDNLNPIWQKRIGGNQNEEAYQIIENSLGNYVLVGYTSSYGNGGKDIFLVSIDSNGDSLWSKTHGGFSDDIGRNVIETATGYLLIGGTESFPIEGNGMNVFIIATNFLGKATQLVTYEKEGIAEGMDIENLPDGGYIFLANMQKEGSLEKPGIVIARLGEQVNEKIWEKEYTEKEGFSASDLEVTDKGFAVMGTVFGISNTNAFLMITDQDGRIITKRELGNEEDAQSGEGIEQTSDNNFIFTGTNGSGGSSLIMLGKIKEDGTL